MPFIPLFAIIAALFFPVPTTHLSTSDAAQVITLSPVVHVTASIAASSAPHLAAAAEIVHAAAKPAVQTASAAAATDPSPKTTMVRTTRVAPAPVAAPTHVASASFSALELSIIADINASRAADGLSALTPDPTLGVIARGHSADMLAQNYFDHTSPAGCSAVCRYQNAGYAYWAMGENIYWMEGYTLSDTAAAQKVVDAWQNSPGHRENDLGKFSRIGIGVARSGSRVYVTADFATPR